MKKKAIFTLVTSLALVLGSFTPALADSTYDITGNGSASSNNVSSLSQNVQTVVQNNNADITNTINTQNNTGGNNASDNTGGSVTIDTGNATSMVTVDNRANLNEVSLGTTPSENNTSAVVGGNGSFSTNNVNLNNSNSTELFQTNDSRITNDIQTRNNTGNNDANRNTGGDVLVLTGHAASDVAVSNAANLNRAVLGASNNNGSGLTSVVVTGNGSASDNSVNLYNNRSVSVVQDNYADFLNRIYNDTNTGLNRANDNTGGSVSLYTGNAGATVGVDNMANANLLAMGNGSGLANDVLAKIHGNGSFSSNNICLYGSDTLSAFQGDESRTLLVNNIENRNTTGESNMNRNTASYLSAVDPLLVSGHSYSDVAVNNTGSVNLIGSNSLSMPELRFNFDLGQLMSLVH